MSNDITALIGSRVSLRHRVDDRAGRPLYSDAVGELGTDGDGLVVHTRRGPVRVAVDAVAAVRVVPPAVPRRAGLAAVVALESLCADAWPAAVDEPLGRWRLRAAGGFTGRANSALAIGDPGLPIPAALAAVVAFAEREGVAPRVQVPVGSPWDKAVAHAGWVLDVEHAAGAEVAVLVAALDGSPPPATNGTPVATCATGVPFVGWGSVPAGVTMAERPDPEWFREAYPPAARAVLDPGGLPPVAFGLLREAGQVVGRVRACRVDEHLHVSMLHTVEHARGRGVASGMLAAAAAWGREQGARWMVLQVALHNAGARSLYARVGAVEHHRYRYLVPPPSR